MNWTNTLLPIAFTTSTGLTLRGWQTPLSGKPIIYFRHGNGFCCLTYLPMLEILAVDFDLIMLDTQGHGDSDSGHQIGYWPHCADHALEHINSCRKEWGDVPLLGVGHSFGGILTLLAAGKQPHLFAGCVLLDPVLFPKSWQPLATLSRWLGLTRKSPLATQALRRRSQWVSRKASYQNFVGRGTFKGWRDDALWAHINHALHEDEHGISLKCSPETEASVFAAHTGPVWKAIKNIKKPMTIVAGKKSYPFVPESARKASQRNSIINHHIVEGGHCFMQEDPEAAAQLVSASLKAVINTL